MVPVGVHGYSRVPEMVMGLDFALNNGVLTL